MYNITSTSISYRAVRDFMIAALEDVPASNFTRPTGLKEVEVCVPSGMKPDTDCARKVKTLLPEARAPKEDDTWWRRAKIDIRDGLLATELTPPQFVQERFGIVIPDDLSDFARGQAQEWARILGGGTLPSERSTGDAPVQLKTPKQNQRVGRIVEITGKAADAEFVAYRLEFGLGDPPAAWTLILRQETPQEDGGLGLWNTEDLPDGVYTLRLVLETRTRGELSTYVVVRIGSNTRTSPSPQPSPTPIVIFPD
jgi:hypothetical protein